jgi:hypothetical protein
MPEKLPQFSWGKDHYHWSMLVTFRGMGQLLLSTNVSSN